MNIRDVGNTAGAFQAGRADIQAPSGNVNNAKGSPAIQAQPAARNDKYIPSSGTATSSTLYDVSDVKNGGISGFSSRIQAGGFTSSGEKITRMIVEMVLPLGRKSLRVFEKAK